MKRWTQQEDDYLSDNWGIATFQKMAKRLNRSAQAIEFRGMKLGLGPTRDALGFINAGQLASSCNVDFHTVTDYWILKLGLKARKRATRNDFQFWQIKINDFWSWAKQHRKEINFSRIEKDALVPEPEWVELERKRDYKEIPKKRFAKWTAFEDLRLINLFNTGKTYNEISQIMDRPRSGCEHRLFRLAKENKATIRKIILPWQDEETNMMLQMDKKGFTDEQIAYELGREVSHIRDHRRRLKLKGLYHGSKWDFAKEG